jgi:hypothetical protein
VVSEKIARAIVKIVVTVENFFNAGALAAPLEQLDRILSTHHCQSR